MVETIALANKLEEGQTKESKIKGAEDFKSSHVFSLHLKQRVNLCFWQLNDKLIKFPKIWWIGMGKEKWIQNIKHFFTVLKHDKAYYSESSLNEHSGSRQLYSLPPSQNPAWTPIQTLYLQISVSRHSHKWPLNTHRNYFFVCVSSKLYEFGIAWRWIALDILSFLEYEHVKMLSIVSVNNNIILHWLLF